MRNLWAAVARIGTSVTLGSAAAVVLGILVPLYHKAYAYEQKTNISEQKSEQNEQNGRLYPPYIYLHFHAVALA